MNKVTHQTVELTSKNGRFDVKLHYTSRLRRQRSYLGWEMKPTMTCVLSIDSKDVVKVEIVKHYRDIDNPALALRIATKQALRAVNWKSLRGEIWAAVLGYQNKQKI